VIGMTGLSDRHHPDLLIDFTGMRKNYEHLIISGTMGRLQQFSLDLSDGDVYAQNAVSTGARLD
jgi:hypothetical protein